MASDKDMLIEFGFSALRAEKAIRATKGSGLQQALDWLDAHANDADIDDPIDEAQAEREPEETAESSGAAAEAEAAEAGGASAQSLNCNECGKQFATHSQAEYHATKSGHQDFSESTEVVKPLTEEEKKQKLGDLQAKLAEKRKKREEEEKEEQRKNELIRRKGGQDVQEQREKLQREQQIKEIEKQRREKEMDKLAKQRVKEQIEMDKRNRAAKLAREKAEREGTQAEEKQEGTSLLKAGLPKVSSNSSQARLQIRPMAKSMEGAQPITHVFEAEQTLADVVELVKEKTGIKHFHLATTFPRKVFGSHHQSRTLKQLGLTPSAALAMVE
ncbi:hypothetical protein GQ54DRAFT_274221 [Martensiomyces pterosporus]|nr:hypothetical protein GQ54DRAFT_274221 [Martensiomyces pterosporus]